MIDAISYFDKMNQNNFVGAWFGLTGWCCREAKDQSIS